MRTKTHRTRDLIAPFIVLGVLAGCTADVRGDGRDGEPEVPPPTPATTQTEGAFRLKMGDGPQLPLESISIDTSDAQLRASLEEGGCADVLTTGGGGGAGKVSMGAGSATLSFVTAAVPTGGLAEWAADEIAGRPHASSADFYLKTKDLPGELSCVVELGDLKLDRLALRGSNDAPRLAWVISSTRSSARPPAGETIDDIAAEPTTAAMLLPAVQKVREAARSAPSDEGGHPLFVAGGGAPPPFDLVLGEDDARALFPRGTGGPRRAILELASPSAAVGFALDLDTVLDGSGHVRATVRSNPVVLAVPPSPGDAAAARLSALRAAAPATADEATAGRLLVLLDGRPSPTSGSLDERRGAIADYWNGNNRRSTFDALLGTFLTVARDEEGAWAYTRLLSSARTFAALDPKSNTIAVPGILRSRMIASAALLDLERAVFPMALPQASTDATLSPHDYGMALAAVARLGEASPLLVAADPIELAGIEPDEIDVSVAAEAERTPDTSVAVEASRRFAATLDTVLGAGSVTETDVARVESESKALRDAIAALQDVTLVRFKVTRGL